MDLLSKLGNVEVQITDKFPAEDMECCRRAESDYKTAYSLYDEVAQISMDAISRISLIPGQRYVKDIEDNVDCVYSCNEHYISQICSYFREKYKISIDSPEWSNATENKYGNRITEAKYDKVPLQYILDSVYEQMEGMSFEEKAFDEVKTDARKALVTYNHKSQYVIKGVKLIVADFYSSYKSNVWGRYQASVSSHHRSFFKALSHFEYGTFDINQKYQFLCGYELDEKDGVYDKHDKHSSVINSIKVFKNGKVEIEFKDYQTAVRFIDTYFPGLPQQEAAA